MPERPQFIAGRCYHLYNRGNNRQNIFFEQDNYLYFLRLLKTHLVLQNIDIVAYCLMPNHYHLLVKIDTDVLSNAMHDLSVAYTKAINKRFNRTGSLFEGRFKAIMVDNDTYLTHLSRYLHLNPVKAGLVSHAKDWAFSSYCDYVGLRNGKLPNPNVILEQFASRADYQLFLDQTSPPDLVKHLLFD
ncbi:MAG: transposase [Anaerolineae bacterium]|nr:transposase [Anaerolineae bacterium]